MFCDLSLAAILSKASCREEAAYTVRLDGGFVLPEPSLPPHEINTTSATTASPLLITGKILAGKSTSPWRGPPSPVGALPRACRPYSEVRSGGSNAQPSPLRPFRMLGRG